MTDTIAAVATGRAVCAIGIVRISGPCAIDAARALFSPFPKADRTLAYGNLKTLNGELLDRCLCTVSHGPHSYTGEDTAEFQCHGSPVVLLALLEELYALGVRQALPGEFTRRAFLNGRMELADAEAVADLIDAETVEGAKNAALQLSGALSSGMNSIYSALVDMCSHFHAVLDYPDEDIEDFEISAYSDTLSDTLAGLEKLLDSYNRGKFLNSGIPTVIAGEPNSGKSSLLNCLLGYDRAIVTSVPGTTRDTIEEKIRIGGVTLRLVDTAGIRNARDEVERIGIERTRKAIESAQLVINVIDGTSPVPPQAIPGLENKKTVTVYNKCDLDGFRGGDINISALTGEGIEKLAEAIQHTFACSGITDTSFALTNSRHAEAIRQAVEYIRASIEALNSGATPDIVLTEVEGAMTAIGLLTGASLTSDVTDRIFSRFCVGK